jgi:16S rRNA processing protein RimM
VAADPDQRVAIAYISRTRGVRGEVRAETLTHSLERFDELSSVVLQREGRSDVPLELERWRTDAKGLLLKFSGVDTPEDARDELVKGYVTVASDQLAPLPEGTYYIDDLVNSTVVDQNGRELGRIAAVMQMPSTDVWVVRGADGETLVPAISDYVVEIGPGRVVVQGLEELFGL